MNRIYKKNDKLIIEVPLKTQRYNPIIDEYGEEMDNIVGVYKDEWNNGLCYRIDMDYKGKIDQNTDYFYKTDCSRTKLKNLCMKLGIEYWEV